MDYARKLGNPKPSSPLRKQSKITTNYKHPTTFTESVIEDKKLTNWKKWLNIRKKDQENYKKILKRNENKLLLNSGDNYRSRLETRELMEIASNPDYFTKNDIDLNFWITPEILSNHGNPHLPCVEVPSNRKLKSIDKFVYVATPDLILEEKGLAKSNELKKSIKHELNLPKMEKLFIQGKHLAGKNIIRKVPIITITTAEETERETNEWSINHDAMIAALRIENEEIVRRLNPRFDESKENYNRTYNWDIKFSSKINEILEKQIFFENKGNIKISYNWRPIFYNSINFPQGGKKVSPFFFNKNRGIILPGQILNFSIWFKAGNTGVKTENWKFVTDPILCREDITFRFWGCCTEEIISKTKVEEIENYLNNRIRDSAIKEILEEIVNDSLIFQPAEPPYEDLFLECDIFTAKNPSYFYNSILIKEFHEIYNKIFSNSTSHEWNLSIIDLRNIILEIEDSEFRQKILSHFVSVCKAASEPIVFSSTKDEKYGKIYNLLCSFFNKFEIESETIIKNVCFQCKMDSELAIENVSSQSRSNSLSWNSTGKLTPQLKMKPKKKLQRESSNHSMNDKEMDKVIIKKWIILKSSDIILYEEIFYLRIYEILKETISKACAIIDSFVRLNEPEN